MSRSVHFPVINIEGDAQARGSAYGRLAQSRIERGLEIYRPVFAAAGMPWDAALIRAKRFIEQLEAYDPEQATELSAIARAAGVQVGEVMMINARTDILYAAPGAADMFDDGCTGAIALPEATRNGDVIHGQNWDWRDACKESVIILRVRPENGPATLNLVEAGTLARCGLNAHGIGITANFLRCDHDPGTGGVPSPFVRRRLLGQRQLSQAVNVMLTAKRSFSNNIMISDSEGAAVNIETTPQEVFWLMEENGLLVHANHFVSAAALARVRDTGLLVTPDSLYRDRRVRAALSKLHGKITEQTLIDALADRFGTPASVNRPPTKGPGGEEISTVASIVMNTTQRTMTVVPTPYKQSESRIYRLEE